jgi:two-component system sensor histidine kinase YesM
MRIHNRLTSVYILIVAIPLLVVTVALVAVARDSLVERARREAEWSVESAAAAIAAKVDLAGRVESIVASDNTFLQFLAQAEAGDEDRIIQFLQNDVVDLVKLQYALPSVHAIRLFIDNPVLPERWPVLFRVDRAAGEAWIQELLAEPGRRRWKLLYRDTLVTNNVGSNATVVSLDRELVYNKRHAAYLQISLEAADFFPAQTADPENSAFLYLDPDGKLLEPVESAVDPAAVMAQAAFRGAVAEAVRGRLAAAASGSFSWSWTGFGAVVAFRRLANPDLVVCHVASTRQIEERLLFIRLAIVVGLALSIGAMYLAASLATRRMLSRLDRIIRYLRQVQSGDLDLRIEVGGRDEMAELAGHFDAMLATVRASLAADRQRNELIRRAEISAMENQINAHFIYNALENIKMRAALDDLDPIADSITALGKLMRYSFKWRTHLALAEEEVAYIRNYLALMNRRNDAQTALELDLPPEVLTQSILKMTIQPLVENALLHGIEPLGRDARITVSGRVDAAEGRFWIEVADDGAGMDADRLEALRAEVDAAAGAPAAPAGKDGGEIPPERVGIGLRNVAERLAAFYGPSFRLTIRSAPGAGTRVRVPFPWDPAASRRNAGAGPEDADGR